MPFKSIKGRNLGKKLPVQKSSDIGKSLGSGSGSSNIKDFVGATGGVISEYKEGNLYYKSHIFYEPGTFTVTNASVSAVDVLLVGGGGGGSTGGGGAGAVIYKENHSVSETGYQIVVGPGGLGRTGSYYQGQSSTGTTSEAFGFSAVGGGGGGAYNNGASTHVPGVSGGSGGGGGWYPGSPPGSSGPATGQPGHPGVVDAVSPNSGWGNIGGKCGSPQTASYTTGGGGGASSAGGDAVGGNSGAGGNGSQYTTLNGESIYFGGGGGGGMQSQTTAGNGGAGGGGGGGIYNATAVDAIGGVNGGEPGSSFGHRNSTPNRSVANPADVEAGLGGPGGIGSGGGGGGMGVSVYRGGTGGPGICVVRYQTPGISGNHTAVDRTMATGGMVYIDYVNKKAVHYFINPGTFSAPETIDADLLVVGGGGGGGGDNGGGGGGGEVAKGTAHSITNGIYNIYVGKGGQSRKVNNNYHANSTEGPGTESGGNGYWSFISAASDNSMIVYARGGNGGNGSSIAGAVPIQGPYVAGPGQNFAGGGSGGGGAGVSDPPGPATIMNATSAGSPQSPTPTITYYGGNAGGNGTGGPLYNAGGGGSSGSTGHPGAVASPDVSSNGANGTASTIFGAMLTGKNYFGAGGGGGEYTGNNNGAGNGGVGGGGGGCGGDGTRSVFGIGGLGFSSGKDANDPQTFAMSDGGIGTGGGGGGDARSVPATAYYAGSGGPGIVAISYTIVI